MKRYKHARDIKVGAVGYGGSYNMGRKHLEEMKRAGMTPAAVAEPDPDRRAAAREEFPGIETYPSLAALLRKSQTDMLAVITPHNTHARLALQALRAGRHVVLEKPMALTTAQCDAMIATARRKGVLVTTYHNRHWDGRVLKALKVIRSGAIGRVVRVAARMGAWGNPGDWWRASRSISGGILYDWGVHLLEYGLQIIDSDAVEVSGFAHNGFWAPRTKWKKDTNEDEAFAVVRFKSGAWMTLCISQLESNAKPGCLEVTGTRGSYLSDSKGWQTITHDGNDEVIRRGKNPESKWHLFYKNVADHLVEGKPLIITPQWARRPIHFLDLAVRSARLGRSLKTKYK